MSYEERVIWAPRLAYSPSASAEPAAEKSPRKMQQQQPAEDESGICQPNYSQDSADPKPGNPDNDDDNVTADAKARRHKPKVFETSGEEGPESSGTEYRAYPTRFVSSAAQSYIV